MLPVRARESDVAMRTSDSHDASVQHPFRTEMRRLDLRVLTSQQLLPATETKPRLPQMGTLDGIRVIQLGGIGPVPFAAMLFADMGAEVLRIDPPGTAPERALGANARGVQSLVLDLKKPGAAEVLLRLSATADVLIEGNRPGVAERLGIGPDACFTRNPKLVYGRMTAFGQDGPYSKAAAHDINVIAVAGVLEPLGPPERPPVPPQALVGDFGGGGMLLAVGVLGALLEAGRSGRGQVVDASMTEGSALIGTYMYEMQAQGMLKGGRGSTLLDGAAPFYGTYETADGKYVAVGAIEPQFYAEFMAEMGIDITGMPSNRDTRNWPELKTRLAEIFKTRTRDEWCARMAKRSTCFTPVLSPLEAPQDPHNRARAAFVERNGITQPAPAPRFSRTPSKAGEIPVALGAHTDAVLARAGYSPAEITDLRANGIVR